MMVKSVRSSKMSFSRKSIFLELALVSLVLCQGLNDFAEARDKGDDIILSKGKIIMRGGKGKGKC